jgi:dihydrofolate reductase
VRKLTYFIAVSIDGFIGAPSGEAGFFTDYVDEEYLEFLKTEHPETMPTHGRKALGLDHLANVEFDTIIQGRASYDLALQEGFTSPFAHMRQFVASRTIGESPDPAVEIVSEPLTEIRRLKREDGLGIYLCGGSRLAGELLEEIDELVLKTYPVVLGSGMPMFGSQFRLTEFRPGTVRTFGNGAVVRRYSRKR